MSDQEKKMFYDVDGIQIGRDGQKEKTTVAVVGEHRMEVTVDGQLTMELVCTPSHLPELVLGHLVSEGIIRTAEEIRRMDITEDGSRAAVELTGTDGQGRREKIRAYAGLTRLPAASWEPAWVFGMSDLFREDTPLHRLTRSTHSCYLAREGQLLFQCEDIGRHNAMHKVIGYCAAHHLNPGMCMVFTSGRIPTAMAVKAIRAGIPVIASKETPTRDAVLLAEQYGLVLIGRAKGDRMIQFTGRG